MSYLELGASPEISYSYAGGRDMTESLCREKYKGEWIPPDPAAGPQARGKCKIPHVVKPCKEGDRRRGGTRTYPVEEVCRNGRWVPVGVACGPKPANLTRSDCPICCDGKWVVVNWQHPACDKGCSALTEPHPEEVAQEAATQALKIQQARCEAAKGTWTGRKCLPYTVSFDRPVNHASTFSASSAETNAKIAAMRAEAEAIRLEHEARMAEARARLEELRARRNMRSPVVIPPAQPSAEKKPGGVGLLALATGLLLFL